MLQGHGRLVDLGLSDHYEQGAKARPALLAQLIGSGVTVGDFKQIATPELVATCVREIMWSPMRDFAPVSPLRAGRCFPARRVLRRRHRVAAAETARARWALAPVKAPRRRRHQAQSRWFHNAPALSAITPWSASDWTLPYYLTGTARCC
jgi:hypothetical protein